MEATDELVRRLECRWNPPVELDSDQCYGADSVGYVGLEPSIFVSQLASIPGRTLLDVGSGIGSKLLLAHLSGFQATGLELNDDYASVSRVLCPEAEVIVADALSFDRYGDFDVVYTYMILARGLDSLEKRIKAQLRPGAHLFLAHRPITDGGWTQLSSMVWTKD